MPPSLILEVLRITEAEMDLREETREVEQARDALADEYADRAQPLAGSQDSLAERTREVVRKIRELPNGEQEFAREIRLLTAVDGVMREAHELLLRPETGPVTIAAETEAIELLLQARRNRGGGGGGGSSPGGGNAGGNTNTPALALIGRGEADSAQEDQRTVVQSTGKSGRDFPEEFRAGLDEYFGTLEDGK